MLNVHYAHNMQEFKLSGVPAELIVRDGPSTQAELTAALLNVQEKLTEAHSEVLL